MSAVVAVPSNRFPVRVHDVNLSLDGAMSTISTALRNFKEPTKDHLTQIFFSIPSVSTLTLPGDEEPTTTYPDVERLDINAVLSMGVQGEEDSYVGQKSRSSTSLTADLGRKTLYHCSISRFCISRPQIRPFYNPIIDHSSSRTSECESGHLCP